MSSETKQFASDCRSSPASPELRKPPSREQVPTAQPSDAAVTISVRELECFFVCGICGLVRFGSHPPVDEATLARMADRLAHRGPDDRGQFLGDGVGLAVTRLAIIDPEHGHQPIANEDASIWVVQNGEIYNYRELADWLRRRGHRLATRSDTEVLVHLYEELGLRFAERLRGMFAIALWDSRKRQLILLRDRLGIKPLFYAVSAEGLVFGSEIKAILAAGHRRELDPLALDDYLSFDYVPGPRTIFQGILRLPPGHLLVASPTAQPQPYWTFPAQPSAPQPLDRQSAIEALRLRLEDAVRSHLVSDVPVGAFLSGGLDSSVIVALMARNSERPVGTFSIGFTEKSYNELPYAREIAERFGTQHHEFVVTPQVIDILDELIAAFDEPFADSSAIATFYLSRLARQHTKVVLSGDGGDEIFGGYVIYQADQLARWMRRLPRFLTANLLVRIGSMIPGSEAKMSWQLRLSRFLTHAHRDPLAAHIGWRMIFDHTAKRRLYSAEYRAAYGHAIAIEDGSLRLARACFDAYPGPDMLNRLMVVDAQTSLVDDMLTKVDRTAMWHGLEVRVPLLDPPLVEWMTVLPSRWKVHRLRLKVLFREVARELLPPSLLRRPKAGFHVPMPGWLKRELRPLVEEVLSEPTLRRQGVFDPQAVAQLVARHMTGQADLSRNLWGLLVFGLWFDRHFERH